MIKSLNFLVDDHHDCMMPLPCIVGKVYFYLLYSTQKRSGGEMTSNVVLRRRRFASVLLICYCITFLIGPTPDTAAVAAPSFSKNLYCSHLPSDPKGRRLLSDERPA